MELKDTIELMQSDDFKDRFKAEFYQLKIRTEKLKAVLDKMDDNTLDFKPNCSYDLLYEQFTYMKNYLQVLRHRAKIENIDIE